MSGVQTQTERVDSTVDSAVDVTAEMRQPN